jgi:hypothetical protein
LNAVDRTVGLARAREAWTGRECTNLTDIPMKFAVGDGRHHGKTKRLLTEHELEVVRSLAGRGAYLNASFARGLGIGVRLWKELKLERQRDEIAAMIAEGCAILHDGLVSNEVSIALRAEDDRERRAATEFLLERRFGYQRNGNEFTLNIANIDDTGQRNGPQLTIVQEALSPGAQAALLALQSGETDPMALDGEKVDPATGEAPAPRVLRSGRVRPQHPFERPATDSEVALQAAWGTGESPANTTVHVRSDTQQPAPAEASSDFLRG